MNREQLQALIAALESIDHGSRRDACERAMRVLDGASFEEAFGSACGSGPWGEVRRLGTADGKKLGDGRRLGVGVAPSNELQNLAHVVEQLCDVHSDNDELGELAARALTSLSHLGLRNQG